ncbi:hypothetical protein P4U57_29320 [Bacillus pseudomycoides]|nr:hypothetical protein [Bacillus pseudomycoides]MED1478256.1 hypothetical protein [Bacillus pseudomycoides]
MIFIIFHCLAEDLVSLIVLDKLKIIFQMNLTIRFGAYMLFMQQ